MCTIILYCSYILTINKEKEEKFMDFTRNTHSPTSNIAIKKLRFISRNNVTIQLEMQPK